MKIVLLNQSPVGDPQIPSVAAGLASASSDLAALDAIGVQHGVNTGLGDNGANADQTITQTVKANFDSMLANMPDFVTPTWFSHNIETQALTQAIRHGPSTQPMANDGIYITVPYLKTQTPNPQMRSAMRELASRTDYTYDADSTTLLSGGAIPTYTEFFDAMSACMVETMQYLQSQFNGSTLYDWRSGAKPLPWIGSGWWENPGPSSPWYFRPQRTANGTRVHHIADGEMVLSASNTENTEYDAAYWDTGLLSQTRKTAEHSKAFFDQAKADLICYTAYVSPSTDDVATVLPGVVSGSGFYPVGVGASVNNVATSRFVPRQDAKDSIYKAIRWSWLEHYRSFGRRIGCYTLPCIDWWTDVDPYWGLGCSLEEWAEVKLAPLFDPVTATEAARHGIPEGLICVGSMVFWNATDYYLRGLFGTTPKSYVNQTIDSGEYVARRNMARRAAGRTNVAVDWSGANDAAITANQWYQALAAILTEDLTARLELTRKVMDRAIRKGAARQTTLVSIRDGITPAGSGGGPVIGGG